MGLGHVLGEVGCRLRRNPDTVRAPDVAFFRSERVPGGVFPTGYWEGAPDIIVEVVSPWDTASEIQTKVREWIEAGASLVLVAHPETRVIEAVRSLTDRRRFQVGEMLDLSDLLPDFSIPVAEIFD